MKTEVPAGGCYLCGGTFSYGVMTRHLKACRGAHPGPLAGRGRERTARVFHLVVEGRLLPTYWLHLEVPADAALTHLDDFLRDIWLECCGHLSAFSIGGETFNVAPEGPGERGMNVALAKALRVGEVFSHEYDFGTPTELRLRVLGERQGIVRGKAVQVLARNNPPPIPCQGCGKTATQVCSGCMLEGEGWLCETCAASHECGQDMLLPVVNSPRVGMCGYTGQRA
ncbi:MAG: hypothetical protein ACE5JL_00820 [Dehalococcoidia bacterium]